MPAKTLVRRLIVSKLQSQSPEDRQKRSLLIQKKVLDLKAFQKSACVFFYVSLTTEVDTIALIEKSWAMGKRVVVPLADLENKELKLYEIANLETDLQKGALGILEPRPDRTKPVDLEEIDLVIVPGIGFDRKNYRMGRGAGFYDRFLSKFGCDVPKIGLAFCFQVVSELPLESHDQKLDLVLTD